MEITIDDALQRGVAAHKEGKLQDAERLYRAILQSQPAHPDANHNLGVLALSVNKVSEAIPLFKAALEANPKIEQFWLSYIDALIKEKKHDGVRQVLEQAKQQGIALEKLQVFEEQLSSKVQASGSASPSKEQLDRLLAHYQGGRFVEAEKLATSLTGDFPNHPFSWKVLGALLGQAGRNAEAVVANQKAVKLSPKDAEAHTNLGIILKAMGRLDDAHLSYRHALVLKPEFTEAYYDLGISMKESKRLRDAEINYKHAILSRPGFTEVYNNLGVVLGALSKPCEAEQSYKKAILLKPDYAEVYNNMGISLKAFHRLDEAEFSYIKAIISNPEYAEVYNNFGSILKERSSSEETRDSYRRSIILKPDYAEAYSNLAISVYTVDNLDRAIWCLTNAIILNPDFLEARINLNTVSNSAVPAWHLAMMNDNVRNSSYFKAIERAIDKGDLILDIGTGSGLLSLMAANCGAGQVLTCETSKTIADNAKKIINHNGYSEIITVINKKSTDLIVGQDMPERADLILSEVLSAELVGEGVRSTVFDATKRLLKPGGKIIPQSGKIKVALIGNSLEVSHATVVDQIHGFDLSKFNVISQKKFSLKLKHEPLFLSDPKDAFDINLNDGAEVTKEEKTIKIRATSDGLCIGLIQWLWVNLYEEIEYENKPGKTNSHWPTPIYLFDKPLKLTEGEVIEIRALLGEDSVWFYKRSIL